MSHRARAQLAKPPVEVADRVASLVGAAFGAWADRFIRAVVQDIVKVEWPDGRTDATVRGLFEEAGRPRPNAEKLREAFTMLDRKSADEARVAGVRAADVVPGYERVRAEWLRTNTDLIRAEADLRRRVERVLADPLNEGRSVADISKMLQEQAGYSQSRAELTARDQTLKAYAQIQQARQTAAGITRYVWTTALDERVRPDHADLDGSVQAWDDPPVVDQRTGRRGHPGEDFQCRCTAVPVLEEDDDPAEPEPAAQQRELRERAVAEGRARAPRVAPPREPRTAPPREPAMVPTQAELAAEQARLAQERARREAEAAADRRITESRARAAEVERRAAETVEQARLAQEAATTPARAALPASELVERATEVEVLKGTRKRALAQIAEAVDGAVAGKSLRELRALDDPRTLRPESFAFLRQDPFFAQTGTLQDPGAASGGLPLIGIEPDGRAYLSNGRHRLTVARELGLRQIMARVIRYNRNGDTLWEYVGYVRI